ncbi:MAG: hypothetical protein WBP45_14395 [Daejeonella sp.]
MIWLHFRVYPTNRFFEQLNLFFNFDHERNFPTYYNTILLFLCSLGFLFIAFTKAGEVIKLNYWLILSIVLLFLSIDDFLGLHEWLNIWIPRHFKIGGKGIFKFAWIIPYGLFSLAFGIYSIKNLLAINKSIAKGYLISGVLYVTGAILIESASGLYYESIQDVFSFEYTLYFVTVEEFLEMFSLILVLYYQILHLKNLTTTTIEKV